MFERFIERSRKVVVLAQDGASRLDHSYIGTEHVLLGLVREGVAARVLLNLDPDVVRREVIRRLPGATTEADPFDETERSVGEREDGTLFRARVIGVRTELEVPRAPHVTVDVDYAYRVSRSSGGGPLVRSGDVLDVVRDELRGAGTRSVEAATTMLGERLLAAFPEMLDVTIVVSGVPNAQRPADPAFSLSATFRR